MMGKPFHSCFVLQTNSEIGSDWVAETDMDDWNVREMFKENSFVFFCWQDIDVEKLLVNIDSKEGASNKSYFIYECPEIDIAPKYVSPHEMDFPKLRSIRLSHGDECYFWQTNGNLRILL